MVPHPTELPPSLRLMTHPKVQVILSIIILCAILLFNSFLYIFHPYDGLGVYQEAPLEAQPKTGIFEYAADNRRRKT